jgi:putative nucleotidyltransferase with HDIG domain
MTAFLARMMALRGSKKEIAETVFIGGLLHNIGQALLFNMDKKKYVDVLGREKEGEELIEAYEEEAFGTNHRQVGAEIFKTWNFPEIYTDIVQEHDSLHITSPHKTIIIYVTVASLITQKAGYGSFNVKKNDLLGRLAPHISVSEEDVELYTEHFVEILGNDSLFSECQSLFGIS